MLHTTRLKLRPVEISDLEPIHALLILPETDEYNTLGIPFSISVTENLLSTWIEDSNHMVVVAYTFAIVLRDTGGFVGLISIKPGKPQYKVAEIWFKLHTDFWGQGYGTEAVKEIIHFGFNDLSLHRIEAGCAVDNIASMKVMEKAGMKQEGRKRMCLPLKSGWSDNFEYAILETDFGKEQVAVT
jgi:RimJ/RimL family protein N-acetyltransferase